MHENGYTDIIAYCQDKRYEKLVEKINETLKIKELIIENKMDASEYLNSIKLSNLQQAEITHEEIVQYLGTYTKQEHKEVPKAQVPFVKPQTKEKVPEAIVSSAEIDIQVDVYNKQNKKYYLKMTQQERDFDDYLDTLDEKYYHESTLNKKNDLVDYFPASGKVKSTQEREELLKMEYKVNREEIAGNNRKMSTIDFEYMNVADKVCGRKNAEKEKSAWPGDMKTLLKSIKTFIDKNKENFGDEKRIEEIYAKVNKQCSLSGTVLSVLIVLQDLFFKCKSMKLENCLYEHKKVMISFFDYYRK